MITKIRPSQQHKATDGNSTSLSLLHDMPNMIVKEVIIEDMASMAATDQAVRAYIEPHLYPNIYTRVDTPQATLWSCESSTKKTGIHGRDTCSVVG